MATTATVVARYQLPGAVSLLCSGVEWHTGCWGAGVTAQPSSERTRGIKL